jgi:hypothetical protein
MAAFPDADANYFFDGPNGDLAVAKIVRATSRKIDVGHALGLVVDNDRLDFCSRQVLDILDAAILLDLALSPAGAFYFKNG